MTSCSTREFMADLDQRVVRRHVAKLEAAGWLARAPWIWGEGSVVWLTGAGIEGAGLGGVRAVKTPPGATTIAHGVLVGWSAARVEHRGRVWKSARELALERERWAVSMRCERGYTKQLPDLVVWLKRSAPPVAVIAESGGRREDRQKMILEGWRDGILSGRYAGVHYHCASASVAVWISRLAKKVRLTGPAFVAAEQMSAEEIAALTAVPNARDELPIGKSQPQPKPGSHVTSGSRLHRPARRCPRRRCRRRGRSHSLKHQRPLPSENAATGRSSDWTSRGGAADGDADVTRAGQP